MGLPIIGEYLPIDIPADTAVFTARLNVLGLEGWEPAFSDPINQRVVLWRPIAPNVSQPL